jgi:hypothetical protein
MGNCLLFKTYSYRCPRADGYIRCGVLKVSETESARTSGCGCGGWAAVSVGVESPVPAVSGPFHNEVLHIAHIASPTSCNICRASSRRAA